MARALLLAVAVLLASCTSTNVSSDHEETAVPAQEHFDMMDLLDNNVPDDYVISYSVILSPNAAIVNSQYSSGRTTSSFTVNSMVVWELGVIPTTTDTLYTTHLMGEPLEVVPKSVAQVRYRLIFLRLMETPNPPPEKSRRLEQI